MSRLKVLVYCVLALLGVLLLWLGVSMSTSGNGAVKSPAVNFFIEHNSSEIRLHRFNDVFAIKLQESPSNTQLTIFNNKIELFSDAQSMAITLKGFCFSETRNTPFLVYKGFEPKTGIEFFKLVELAHTPTSPLYSFVNNSYFNLAYQDALPLAPVKTAHYEVLPACLANSD